MAADAEVMSYEQLDLNGSELLVLVEYYHKLLCIYSFNNGTK